MLVLVIAFVLIGWVSLARIVRGAVLVEKQELYVEAARQLGMSQRRILFRHILPNCLALVIVWLMAAISRVIILEAFLGYVGVEISGFVEPRPGFCRDRAGAGCSSMGAR